MCIYEHIRTCTYIYICICIYIKTDTYRYEYMYIHKHTYIHICIYIYGTTVRPHTAGFGLYIAFACVLSYVQANEPIKIYV